MKKLALGVAMMAFVMGALAENQGGDGMKNPPHAGAVFKRLDTNHDGLLSRDEVRGRPKLEKRFERIDRNHDQRLSRVELRAARKILREHKS